MIKRHKSTTVILVWLLWLAKSEQQHSSCETSGTVLEGDAANIFCNFSRPYQNFVVYRLPSSTELDENTRKPKIAVVCTWEGHHRTCDLGDHQVTTTSNRDLATITIPSVKQEHSGEYFCKTQPAKEDNATSCTLTVQSNKVRRQDLITCYTKSPVPIGEETSVVCEFSKSIASTGITLTKQGTSPVEILHCDTNHTCTMFKEGYTILETSDTHVRFSIPSAKLEDAGDYMCSSDLIQGLSGKCTLELTQAVPGKDVTTPVASTVYFGFAIISVLMVVLTSLLLLNKFGVWKKCPCRREVRACSRETGSNKSGDSNIPCLDK